MVFKKQKCVYLCIYEYMKLHNKISGKLLPVLGQTRNMKNREKLS